MTARKRIEGARPIEPEWVRLGRLAVKDAFESGRRQAASNSVVGLLREAIRFWDDAQRVAFPLVRIADAYDGNALDDEARKFYGAHDQFRTDGDPKEILMVTGRGGATMLTLQECLEARRVLGQGRPEEDLDV